MRSCVLVESDLIIGIKIDKDTCNELFKKGEPILGEKVLVTRYPNVMSVILIVVGISDNNVSYVGVDTWRQLAIDPDGDVIEIVRILKSSKLRAKLKRFKLKLNMVFGYLKEKLRCS